MTSNSVSGLHQTEVWR